jgi:cytochrome c oxidase cbb3-type subunit 3
MSDFIHGGWSVFVAGATILSLVWCLWLLYVASNRTVMADDNTTGHVWDVDLKEMNNPLPRWWFWLFVATVLFAAVYLALYPGLGKFQGTLGWSSVGQYETEQQRAQQAMAAVFDKFKAMPAEALAKDSQAMGIGERLFGNNCAGCHGSDAKGSKGFPNLTDGDWLYGGSPETIAETITKGRTGTMPPMAAAVGTADDARNVANYVLSLSGSAHNSAAAQLGKPKFVVCAACHGPEGKGNPALGAPNLTDKVWLHGWGEAAIVAVINGGKTNVMPAFGERLSAEQIHVLAAYVWSLSQRSTVASK